jgi:hypothetical protein
MAEDPSKSVQSLSKIEGDRLHEPVQLVEDETGHRVLLYSTGKGIEVQLRYEGDALWMTQAQISELFGRDQSVISRHIGNILEEGELLADSNMQKVHTAQATKPVTIYSLDMVISVGYRASSAQATLFRKWATQKLVQFATKGFVVDVERLKDPANRDYFRELRETIREIRASEANVYRELRDVVALCSDYASLPEHQKTAFFAAVQNKLLYAVTGMTAAELRVARANASEPNMGLTAWKGAHPTKADILVAKNYLGTAEMRDLNRFTNMLLDYFEQQADLQKMVQMADAEAALSKFIVNNERHVLGGGGSMSRSQADEHCNRHYDIFNDMRKQNYLQEPDADA